RGPAATNLPVWTEEDLAEEAKKRGPAATNLPVWTEEDLVEETKKRKGGSIPKWEEDEELFNCPKCGYKCRPGWKECPGCGAEIKENGTTKSEKE
ncbi:MAG: hypothetical protein ACTSWY_07520, partial [Promethearchaeota archaeon]